MPQGPGTLTASKSVPTPIIAGDCNRYTLPVPFKFPTHLSGLFHQAFALSRTGGFPYGQLLLRERRPPPRDFSPKGFAWIVDLRLRSPPCFLDFLACICAGPAQLAAPSPRPRVRAGSSRLVLALHPLRTTLGPSRTEGRCSYTLWTWWWSRAVALADRGPSPSATLPARSCVWEELKYSLAHR